MKNLMIIATCATMLLGSGAAAFAGNCGGGNHNGINRGHHHNQINQRPHHNHRHHRRGR